MRGILLLSFLVLFACAHKKEKKQTEQVTSVEKIEGARYTTLVFPEGSSELTTSSKEALKSFAQKVRERRKKIEDIKILAWADQEYPQDKKSKGSTREVILAGERAQNIKDFLKEDLQEDNQFDTFNMARRPDRLSKTLKDEDYEVKKAYEESGVTGSQLPDGSISYTKASKALIIINYEGEDRKL